MLNRRTSTVRSNDSRPWDAICPRRAQTTNCTIHDGYFITDNRTETTVHHDNRQTINDSSSSTVFNGPIQGYVHTANNGGAVKGYVQITNVFHTVGGSGEANPRGGHNTTVSSQTNNADRTISQKDATQMRRGNNLKGSNNEPELPSIVGDVGSSALTDKLEQELQSLSPNMQAFVRTLQVQQNAHEREKATEPVKRRNRTM